MASKTLTEGISFSESKIELLMEISKNCFTQKRACGRDGHPGVEPPHGNPPCGAPKPFPQAVESGSCVKIPTGKTGPWGIR
jgi:hypothetical protein